MGYKEREKYFKTTKGRTTLAIPLTLNNVIG
jgi:hypothetical protein